MKNIVLQVLVNNRLERDKPSLYQIVMQLKKKNISSNFNQNPKDKNQMQNLITNLYTKSIKEMFQGRDQRFKRLEDLLYRLQLRLDDKNEKMNNVERLIKSISHQDSKLKWYRLALLKYFKLDSRENSEMDISHQVVSSSSNYEPPIMSESS